MRRSMRSGSTSTQRATPSFMVTARGWAPPIPPSPAVRQMRPFKLPESLPIRPVRHEQGVRDEHPRSPLVCLERRDGLAGLHQQGLVVVQTLQRAHDGPEAVPVAGGLASATVHDEVFWTLGDLGVEVVHEHAQGGFLVPALARELHPARGADDGSPVRHLPTPPPWLRFSSGRSAASILQACSKSSLSTSSSGA